MKHMLQLLPLLLIGLGMASAQSLHQEISTPAYRLATWGYTNMPPSVPGHEWPEEFRVYGLAVSIRTIDDMVSGYTVAATLELDNGDTQDVSETFARPSRGPWAFVALLTGKIKPKRLVSLTITPLRGQPEAVPLTR